MSGSTQFGLLVWLQNPEFREPHGTLLFDTWPTKGTAIEIDGKEWIVKSVNDFTGEVVAELPEQKGSE